MGTNSAQASRGMKEKGGRLVPNCVPKESTGRILSPDRRMERGGR